MKNRILKAVGTIVGSLAIVATWPVAANAADESVPSFVSETYVDARQVVHYAYDPAERPGAIVEHDLGTRNHNGGCTFEASGGGDATTDNDVVIIVDEVSFNPQDCSRMLSVAEYPAVDVPASVSAELEPQKGSTYESASTSGGSANGFAPMASWSQKLSAWVGDPIGIHVTETKITRDWSSTGSWDNNHEWGWYSPTGWTRSGYDTVGSATVGDTLGYFHNVAFCDPTAVTYSSHYRTRLTTATSGSWDWRYSMDKSGDCSALLSYHYALG